MITIAACQIAIDSGNIQENFEKIIDFLWAAGDEGADLVVFPELCLCGNQFDKLSDIQDISLESSNSFTSVIQDCCRNYNMTAVVGFIENAEGKFFNTTAVIGPVGVPFRYRKTHLGNGGVDVFLSEGEPGFPAFDLTIGRIGVNIYDDRIFLKSCRGLARNKADIIVVPASETVSPDYITETLSTAKAINKNIHYVLANRVGTENETVYTGCSRIIDPKGDVIAMASDTEEIIFATADRSGTVKKRAVSF